MHAKFWEPKILNWHVVEAEDDFGVGVSLGTNIISFLRLLLQKMFSANFRYPPFHEFLNFSLIEFACNEKALQLLLFSSLFSLHIKSVRTEDNCLPNFLHMLNWTSVA